MNNLKVAALASVILLNNNVALASNAEDRYIYIGTELGISEPVVKEFSYKSQAGETKMRLKQSRMYGGLFFKNLAILLLVSFSILSIFNFYLAKRPYELSKIHMESYMLLVGNKGNVRGSDVVAKSQQRDGPPKNGRGQ